MWSLIVRYLSVCFCLSMLAALAWAQSEPSTSSSTISLPKAIARTISRNPDLIVFDYQIEAAEAQLLQAELRPNPCICGERIEILRQPGC